MMACDRPEPQSLHDGGPYAVSQRALRDAVAAWIEQPDAALRTAQHGVRLSPEQQRRRWILLGLLEEGLDAGAYAVRFGARPTEHLPELAELTELGLARNDGVRLLLTDEGRACSDVIGHWLQSAPVRALREAWSLR